MGLGITSAVLVFGFTVTAVLVGVFDIQSSCFAGVLHTYHPSRSTVTIDCNNLIYTLTHGRVSPHTS